MSQQGGPPAVPLTMPGTNDVSMTLSGQKRGREGRIDGKIIPGISLSGYSLYPPGGPLPFGVTPGGSMDDALQQLPPNKKQALFFQQQQQQQMQQVQHQLQQQQQLQQVQLQQQQLQLQQQVSNAVNLAAQPPNKKQNRRKSAPVVPSSTDLPQQSASAPVPHSQPAQAQPVRD
jgi:hypothetical protein